MSELLHARDRLSVMQGPPDLVTRVQRSCLAKAAYAAAHASVTTLLDRVVTADESVFCYDKSMRRKFTDAGAFYQQK